MKKLVNQAAIVVAFVTTLAGHAAAQRSIAVKEGGCIKIPHDHEHGHDQDHESPTRIAMARIRTVEVEINPCGGKIKIEADKPEKKN